MMRAYGDRLYRSRQGMIFGVCRGIADFAGLEVFWVRVFAVAGLLISGFWPVGLAYVVCAFLVRLEPLTPLHSNDEAEFYSSYVSSREMAIHRLRRMYENLDRRIQRIEHQITTRGYDWDQRLKDDR